MNYLGAILISVVFLSACSGSLFGRSSKKQLPEVMILLFPSSFVKPAGSSIGDDKFALRLRGVVYQYESGRASIDYRNGGELTFKPTMSANLIGYLFATRTRQFFTVTPSNRHFELLLSVSAEQQLKNAVNKKTKFGDVIVVSSDERDPTFVKITIDIDANGGFMVDVPARIGDNIDQSDENTLIIDRASVSSEDAISPFYWVQARIQSVTQPGFFIATETRANIIGLQEDELQIISDVDDTVKKSRVNQGLHVMVRSGLLREYEAVEGMSNLFKHIAAERHNARLGKTGYHFLSASPWALLTSYINDFFIANDFPWASVTSRVKFPRGAKEAARMSRTKGNLENFDNEEAADGKVPNLRGKGSAAAVATYLDKMSQAKRNTGAFKFKHDRIDEIVKGPSWNQIMFFGDSTEADAEAAKYLVEQHNFIDNHHGGKVVCIFLRFVASKAARTNDAADKEHRDYMKRVKHLFSPTNVFSRTNNLDRVRVFRQHGELDGVDFGSLKCHSELSKADWNSY